jgi:hypothetical protein
MSDNEIKLPDIDYPYYDTIISIDDLKNKISDMKNIKFESNHEPYEIIAINKKTDIMSNIYDGKYVKFVDSNYLEYDLLPLFFSERELVKCKIMGYDSLVANFNKYKAEIIDDMEKSNMDRTPINLREYVFKNIKHCHNFRPTLAINIYRFFKAQSVFDFSAGWGDRLFGACVDDIKYVGLDPNINNTFYSDIIDQIGNINKQTIIATGAEYLPLNIFEKTMKGMDIDSFDLMFTSPPYFTYEIYAANTQSITSYINSFENWLVNFLFYVMIKYSVYLKENGYFVLYIQDVGGHSYLEPMFMAVMSKYETFNGLKFVGFISATRFPMIVFQKKKTDDRNYTNPETKINHTIEKISNKFMDTYPKIAKLTDMLTRLRYKNLYFEVNDRYDYDDKTGSIEIWDICHRSSFVRGMFKLLLTIPKNIKTIIYYGSIAIGNQIYYLATFCKLLGFKLIYHYNPNEIGWIIKDDTKINKKLQTSEHLAKAIKMGLNAHPLRKKNTYMDDISYLEQFIKNRYKNNDTIMVLPLDIYVDNKNILLESLRERLMFIPELKPDKQAIFDKTIYMNVNSKSMLECFQIIFPNANFGIICNEFYSCLNGDNNNKKIKVFTNKDVFGYDFSYGISHPSNGKLIADNNIPNNFTPLYTLFKKYQQDGDICFFAE